MRGVIFYLSILAFTSGIFVRSFFDITTPVIVWVLLLASGLGCWWFKKRTVDTNKLILFPVVAMVCFVLGVVRLDYAVSETEPSPLASQLGTKATLQGVVVAEPEVTDTSTRLVVDVVGEKVLVATDRYAEVAYGDEVTVLGKLQKPESFETEFGRTFNYPGYLSVRDIFYTVSFAQVAVLERNKGNKLLTYLFLIKETFLTSIQSTIPEPQVGLGAGLLLGVKSSLGEKLEEDFRTTGIIHIVVLSGTNIMLVVIFVMYVLALVLPIRTRAVIGIVAIILFALLVGLSATVVRASIMAVLILAALLLGKRYYIMRALFFTGALMLLINPLLLVFDVGFQLSFLATLGLIIVAPQFEQILAGVPSWFKLKEFFIATVATQVMILPLLLYQIGQFSVVAVVVNMLVLPMVPLAMLATFLAGLIGLVFPALAQVIAIVAYAFLSYIIIIATWFAALPFASFIVPTFPFTVMVLAYVFIGLGFYWLYYRRARNIQFMNFSSVSGWTIVEEADIVNALQTKERPLAERSVGEASSTPIFFR